MGIRNAFAMATVLAGLMACEAGSTYGTNPQEPVAGPGGGAVGSVAVGSDVQFVSSHNGSTNPAVDTISVGSTVTWSWRGNLQHSVQSIGSPSFASSVVHAGSGSYTFTFTTPGTYPYDCAVHGQAMTGTIVVK